MTSKFTVQKRNNISTAFSNTDSFNTSNTSNASTNTSIFTTNDKNTSMNSRVFPDRNISTISTDKSNDKIFNEKEAFENLKDEDFFDNPDLSNEVEKQVQYNVQSKAPEFEDYKKYVLIIDNIPAVPLSKLERLKSVMNNTLGLSGATIVDVWYPINDEKGKGFCFVLLESENECLKLKQTLDNHRFDANYTLRAYTLADREALINKKHQEAGSLKRIEYFELEGLYFHLNAQESHLALCAYSGTVNLYTVDPSQQVGSLKNFSLSKIQWSPKGSYLVGFTEQGLVLSAANSSGFGNTTSGASALSGSTNINSETNTASQKTQPVTSNFSANTPRQKLFPHTNVISIEFSQCERFFISYGFSDSGNVQKMLVNVWDTNYNIFPLKTFSGNMKCFTCFKLSYNGDFLSFLSDENLSIYDLKSNALVSGRPLKIPQIQSLSWCSSGNYLVYWEKSVTDSPSLVMLLSVASFEKRILLKSFNLEKCLMVWNQNETKDKKILALVQTRVIKKSSYFSLEIIHISPNDVSVESFQFKQPIEDFSFEPFGSHAIAISANEVTVFQRINDTTYSIIKSFNCAYNQILWSPFGRSFIIASTKSDVFFEVYLVEGKNVSLIVRDKHIKANYISWSSTGKYFLTSSVGPDSSDSKVLIWSNCGYTLETIMATGLAYTLWRPRNNDFISTEEIEEIWNHMDNYAKNYQRENIKFKEADSEETHLDTKLLYPYSTKRMNHIKRISSLFQKHSKDIIAKFVPVCSKELIKAKS